jgi:hypothetical protein
MKGRSLNPFRYQHQSSTRSNKLFCVVDCHSLRFCATGNHCQRFFDATFRMVGQVAGGGTPGGLPLIFRFSRSQGWQPGLAPVNPISQWGTLILVTLPVLMRQGRALTFPCGVLQACTPPGVCAPWHYIRNDGVSLVATIIFVGCWAWLYPQGLLVSVHLLVIEVKSGLPQPNMHPWLPG